MFHTRARKPRRILIYDNTNPPTDTRPTIFLLAGDDDVRQSLKENLRRQGFRVLVVVDMADAHDWLDTGPFPANLVLIDLVRQSPEEALAVGRKLRDQAKYDGHTPLVVVAEKFAEELEGTNDNVSGHDWVCYYEDGEQLHGLIAKLAVRKAA